MAKATLTRDVDLFTVVTASASQPNLTIRPLDTLRGDMLIRSICLRYDSTVGGTSTPTRVTAGHIFYANAITLESDKLKNVVDNMDGFSLHKLLAFEYGSVGLNTAMTSTPADSDTPSCAWVIPLTLRKGIRPYDTHLDMIKQALTMKVQYGAVTNLWTQSGGSPVVTTVQGISAKVINGPIEPRKADGSDAGEEPIYARYFGQRLNLVTATESRKQIPMPFNKYIYRRVMLEGRVSSTKIDLATVIVGTGRVSLEVNNVPIISNVRLRDIAAFNKVRYGIPTAELLTATYLLDFDDDEQERFQDMLKTITTESGSAYLYLDVVYNAATDAVLTSWDALMEIDPAAMR